jgi:hypothetical protein
MITSHEHNSEKNTMSEPMLRIFNKHVAGCDPPAINNLDNEALYIGYFENSEGEQWVFVFDRETEQAELRGGDVGWNTAFDAHDGKAQGVILRRDEAEWLAACWRAAAGEIDAAAQDFNFNIMRGLGALFSKVHECEPVMSIIRRVVKRNSSADPLAEIRQLVGELPECRALKDAIFDDALCAAIWIAGMTKDGGADERRIKRGSDLPEIAR